MRVLIIKTIILTFLLTVGLINSNAQTKKVQFKDFFFMPFSSQISSDNPLELPYTSNGNQIKITVDETEYTNHSEFLNDNPGSIKSGGFSNSGLKVSYFENESVENEKMLHLTGIIIAKNNGAAIVVNFEYPQNNNIAAKNALTMLKSFRANSPGISNPPVTVQPKTINPVVVKPTPATTIPAIDIPLVLAAHNKFRNELGIPDLTWSPELASFAQNWANEIAANRNCEMQHRPRKQNDPWNQKFGENVFFGSSNYTTETAVNYWGSEKADFNFTTKECKDASKDCGHYTQIIWKTTTKVGCGIVKCSNGNTFIVCNYDPPGNWTGEKPY